MLLTIKSSKSKTALPSPSGWKADHKLYPNTHGRDNTVIATRLIRHDFFLLQWNKSIQHEIIFSNTASIVENAANVIKTKNKVPHMRPPAIPLKILGRVTKISPGPWSGLISKAKQVGNIISPETNATKVSNIAMFTDSPSRLRFLSI